MMNEKPLLSASFDPKVKTYWLIFAFLLGFMTVIGIVLLPLVVIVGWQVAQRMLDAMSAELFARKLVVKRGVLFRVEKSIPLEKITDVGLTQGPLMRAMGLYRLDLETAGQSGSGALVSLLGVIDAAQFRERVLAQKDRLQLSGDQGGERHAESDQLSGILESVRNIERMLAERD
ncbi:MAG: PH domain-containing protein [Halieaceae bacterium]|jgi:putative membrane protein|nr:PH domain-containing protein [Halieaceae bacterium]